VTLDGPEVIEFSTLSYSGIPGCPPDFYLVDINSNLYAPLDDQETGYAATATLANERLAAVKTVADFYAQYAYSDPKLGVATTYLQADITEVANWLDAVQANPIATPTAPTFKGVPMGWPVPQYAMNVTDGFGGLSGTPFNDLVNNDKSNNIDRGCRFLGLSVFADKWIDGIETTYQIGDKAEVDCMHGNNAGDDAGSVYLVAGEYVTSITLYMCRYAWVSQIQITTNYQTYPAIPSSPLREEGPSTWTTPSGQIFVGFAGSESSYIDKLRPVYFNGQPATWLGATP
jgi:hypothetical protein